MYCVRGEGVSVLCAWGGGECIVGEGEGGAACPNIFPLVMVDLIKISVWFFMLSLRSQNVHLQRFPGSFEFLSFKCSATNCVSFSYKMKPLAAIIYSSLIPSSSVFQKAQ